MLKILLLGKNGQVGWELQRALAPLGELIVLDRSSQPPLSGDLADLKGLVQTIHILKPTIVVNAAAYTAVDKAESDAELAYLINAKAPGIIAKEVAALGGWFVHYSSDYVFNGSGDNYWKETDTPEPINCYGQSKLEGERAIQQSGCNHLIFRTSWVYGAHGNNFAKTMLRLAAERETLSIVADQIGAPTGAELLADITAHALNIVIKKPELSGLYHLAPKGECSWYDYAKFAIEYAKNLGKSLQVETINPIQSNDYKTPAKRPYNSRLDTTKLTKAFSLHLPNWQIGVARMLEEILGQA